MTVALGWEGQSWCFFGKISSFPGISAYSYPGVGIFRPLTSSSERELVCGQNEVGVV